MDFTEGNDLLQVMSWFPNRETPTPKINIYFSQLLSGLSHCHQNWICHGDLRPEIINIDQQDRLQIQDFSSARQVGGGLFPPPYRYGRFRVGGETEGAGVTYFCSYSYSYALAVGVVYYVFYHLFRPVCRLARFSVVGSYSCCNCGGRVGF